MLCLFVVVCVICVCACEFVKVSVFVKYVYLCVHECGVRMLVMRICVSAVLVCGCVCNYVSACACLIMLSQRCR